MADRPSLFFKVIKAELEDLYDDFILTRSEFREKLDKQEIGTFVYQENEALLAQEGECVSQILQELKKNDLSSFATVEAIIDKIRLDVRNLSKKYEYPQSIEKLVEKRIHKVCLYISA